MVSATISDCRTTCSSVTSCRGVASIQGEVKYLLYKELFIAIIEWV